MAYLRNLPDNATLLDLFRAFPDLSRPLIAHHEVLLRGPGPLSPAERELIAAYVSGLNDCRYCHGVHTATARAFGIDEKLLAALVEDVDTAPVEEKLKPLLHYMRKLTRLPSRLTPADAEAVYAAGWDVQALHMAITVCAMFNFMNRLVEGAGIVGDSAYYNAAARRLHDHGYAVLADLLPKT